MSAASLPMYNLPEMREANARFWAALVEVCRADADLDLPTELVSDRAPVPSAIEPDVVFTQTCGYPLQNLYRDQAALLARPRYEAPGCEDAHHSAVIVVAAGSRFESLEALRGAKFALNSVHSNSGMNLPRRLFAPMARGGRFFGEVVTTGGHGPSMTLVADGAADVASIDCLTFAFYSDQRPDFTARLRVLAFTGPTPTIPFVTSASTPPRTREALTRGLFRLASDPRYRPVLAPLRLVGMEPAAQADYAAILEVETEAAALGYATIA